MHVSRMVVAFLVGGLLTGPAVEVARAQVPPSLQYYSVTPCRVLDTRLVGQGPALASGAPRIVTVTGSCGIPATARAIAGIVTSVGPTGAGNLRLYAGDGAVPPTSALNFSSARTRGNNGVFPLAGNGSGSLAILATVTGSGTVNVVLDVAGYFAAGPCPIELTVKNYLAQLGIVATVGVGMVLHYGPIGVAAAMKSAIKPQRRSFGAATSSRFLRCSPKRLPMKKVTM